MPGSESSAVLHCYVVVHVGSPGALLSSQTGVLFQQVFMLLVVVSMVVITIDKVVSQTARMYGEFVVHISWG